MEGTTIQSAAVAVTAVSPCARSDTGGEVLLGTRNGLCRPDGIFIERYLCPPIPVACAKTYLKLPRRGRGPRVSGAMAVYKALQFRKEVNQIFVWGSSA